MEGGLAIIDMLKENCYITHLDISNNNITSTGAYALADTLTANSTVVHCNLSGTSTHTHTNIYIYIYYSACIM